MVLIIYGFNMGIWFIYDLVSGCVGNGVFCVNWLICDFFFWDGFSNMVGIVDVCVYMFYVRNMVDFGL